MKVRRRNTPRRSEAQPRWQSGFGRRGSERDGDLARAPRAVPFSLSNLFVLEDYGAAMSRPVYRVIRDLHLYSGLFISPFILVFAVSVFFLVHRLSPSAAVGT